MSTVSSEIYGAFEKAINEGKFEEWTKTADMLLKFSANGIEVRHLEAVDIVSNIIKATLDGTRPWDIERVKSIDAYMKTAMRSEVWNLKQNSKRIVPIAELMPGDEQDGYEDEALQSKRKEKEGDDFLREFENRDLFNLCYSTLQENDDHQLIFLAMKDFGYSDNKGIAEYYGIPVEKVAYIKKELLKKLSDVISKYRKN